MNKEEYADKFMPRAKQDIKMCENEHELQIYIAGLLENIDYWQNEYDYIKKHRDILQQENKQLKEQLGKLSKLDDTDFWLEYNRDVWKIQNENEKLKERIEYLERSVERQEKKAMDNYDDYIGILTNWNKLKEYVDIFLNTTTTHLYTLNAYRNIQNKIQELEGDNNE